jgi:hypothetical protein
MASSSKPKPDAHAKSPRKKKITPMALTRRHEEGAEIASALLHR